MSDFEPVPGYQTINVYRSGFAAKLELNRPDRMNAWDAQLGLDLKAAVQAVARHPGIRAVQITGAGRAFSSGADIRDSAATQTPDGHPDVYSVLTDRYHPIVTGIREMPKPVIAAVNGAAAGIGLSLALACDLVLAAESAYFLLAFVNIGLVPDGGSSMLVPARIGFARATELAMLGERLAAPKALDWGLIQVWPDADLAARADELTLRLRTADQVVRGHKRQLNRWLYEGVADQLGSRPRSSRKWPPPDFAEGLPAFAATHLLHRQLGARTLRHRVIGCHAAALVLDSVASEN
jgi:2-(1,2-epoxy-1,2-dihydrophenyl)acetyl-CoA isomerase